MKKIIILLLCIIISIGSVACGMRTTSKAIKTEEKVREYFNDSFGFQLPSESKIAEFSSEDSNDLKAKILINAEDIESIKINLEENFETKAVQDREGKGIPGNMAPTYSQDDIISLKKRAAFFDFEYDDIEVCYRKFTAGQELSDGKMPQTVTNWIILCPENNESYSLYVALIY